MRTLIFRSFFLGLVAFGWRPVALCDSTASLKTEEVRYSDGETEMRGFLAYQGEMKDKPGVLIVHEWWGHNDYARYRAQKIAEQGYVALALDMYGGGKTASHPKDAGSFSKAVMSNLPLANRRFLSAYELLRSRIGNERIGALGYCFGGAVSLQMARMGVPLKAVVTFHGSLGSKTPSLNIGSVKAKLLVFNGADDPFVTAEQIQAFKSEMQGAGVSLEFVNIPGAVHSFTNPEATEFGRKFNLPLAYSEEADALSWTKTIRFLKAELF